MYYLPINISERRIHICEMSNEKKDPVFGFLFTGDTLFQTNPYGHNELIADHGENLNLEDYHFEVRKEDDIDGKAVYGFFIKKDEDNNDSDNNENAPHRIDPGVPFSVDPDNNSFCTTGVKIKFVRNGSKRIAEDSFIVNIHYNIGEEDFCYSFKGYLASAGDTGNITDAAIDFGSEASQIKVGTSRMNINHVMYEYFYSKTGWHKVPEGDVDIKNGLWQSDKNYDLYRSVYFIHKKPGITKFAEVPNKNGETTFIQALMPLNVEKDYYKDLILLPNLKLMDIMGDANNVMMTPIEAFEGSDILNNTVMSNLTDHEFRQNTLRLILSNLLHCIITKTNTNTVAGKRYLRLVMLMPNVYNQRKVYSIIEGLYRDFDTIVENDEEMARKFAGIEIAVISESDASFLGALQSHNDMITSVPDAPHQYFLIVDAGKGTTDFSIMRASDGNICVWNSLYRGGLPASGHAMTYAIYEAIWAFFKRRKNLDLDTLLREESDRTKILEFMNQMETLKSNYSTFTVQPDDKIELSTTCESLNDVNANIKELIKHGYLVEGTHEIMEKKVDEMSQIVVLNIKKYMISAHRGCKFGRVLLTGRAFMLDAFRNALIKHLNDEGLADENCTKSFNGDELKRLCLDGSMAIGSKFFINNNSELICRPTIVNHWTKRPLSRLIDAVKKILKLLEGGIPDDSLYYDGIEVEDSKNAQITMGLGSSWINGAEHVYYVGRGLLVKSSNGNNRIDELILQNVDDPEEYQLIERLTRESLFPYHPSSICAPNTHQPLYSTKHSSTPTAPTNAIDITNKSDSENPNESGTGKTSGEDKFDFDNM